MRHWNILLGIQTLAIMGAIFILGVARICLASLILRQFPGQELPFALRWLELLFGNGVRTIAVTLIVGSLFFHLGRFWIASGDSPEVQGHRWQIYSTLGWALVTLFMCAVGGAHALIFYTPPGVDENTRSVSLVALGQLIQFPPWNYVLLLVGLLLGVSIFRRATWE